jgi:hypothetical protein
MNGKGRDGELGATNAERLSSWCESGKAILECWGCRTKTV